MTVAKPKTKPKAAKSNDGDVQAYGKRNPADHTPSRDCACGPKLVGLPGVDGQKYTTVCHR